MAIVARLSIYVCALFTPCNKAGLWDRVLVIVVDHQFKPSCTTLETIYKQIVNIIFIHV